MVTLDLFLSRFNLNGVVAIDNNLFEALKGVALKRWETIFGDTYPKEGSELDKEILLHLILIEVLKTFNYLLAENSQRFSINKVSEHVERLVWLKKNSETQTS